MRIETNKSGIRETFNLGNYGRLGKFKKIAKLATIRSIPVAIRQGRVIEDDVGNVHNDGENKTFAYIEYPTVVDGIDVTLKLAIKKSPQKNKFWVHSIYTIGNVSDSLTITKNGNEVSHITADTKPIVPQNSDLSTSIASTTKEKVANMRNISSIK